MKTKITQTKETTQPAKLSVSHPTETSASPTSILKNPSILPAFTYPDKPIQITKTPFSTHSSVDHHPFMVYPISIQLSQTHTKLVLRMVVLFWSSCQIYPEPILKTSLPYYQKQTPQPSILILSKIAFHIDMEIPWICSWHFHLTQLQPDMPMSLVKQFRVKWWDKYDQERCSITSMQKFFTDNRNIERSIVQLSRSIPTEDQRQHSRQLIQQYGQHPQQQRPTSPTGSGSSSKSKGKKAALQEIYQALQKTLDVFDSDSDEVNQQDEPMQDTEDPFGGPCAQDPNEI
ncbi:unnamed protein product, partial [Brassica oleracea]